MKHTNSKTTKENTIEIIKTLKDKHQTITFAESCTGGRIAAEFTAISGASSVLMGSCVTYANEIKSQWLNVQEQTLLNHGAVSKECVQEMLVGILKISKANHAIAVSGIAGPSGGTAQKPVGTVFIGIQNMHKSIVEVNHFLGDREAVQKRATHRAIELLKNNL